MLLSVVAVLARSSGRAQAQSNYEHGPRQQGADEVEKGDHPKDNKRNKRGGKTRYTYKR
jgi:hypothetical protein